MTVSVAITIRVDSLTTPPREMGRQREGGAVGPPGRTYSDRADRDTCPDPETWAEILRIENRAKGKVFHTLDSGGNYWTWQACKEDIPRLMDFEPPSWA